MQGLAAEQFLRWVLFILIRNLDLKKKKKCVLYY